jgi:putative hydrolase
MMTVCRTKTHLFKRFLDLQSVDLNCDFHMHTDRTDGKAGVQEIIDLAVERGLKQVAFTEHVRQDTDWFSSFVQEVRSTAQHYPQLNIYVGCEAKALNSKGGFDVSSEILAASDVVLGSVHRFPNGLGGYLNSRDLSAEEFARIEFDLAMGLIEAAPIDVLAHPGGMYSKRYGDFPKSMMRDLMQASLDQEIAIEINTAYLRNLSQFVELCADVNPYVSIGSDVHRLEQLGNCRGQLQTLGVGRE